MKRKYLTLLLVLLSTATFAQYGGRPDYGFRLGLTAHPTLGWIKPETGKTNGLALGFSYGLLGDFNFAENYSFSTGLTVTTINGKSTELDVPPYHSAEASSAYDLRYKLQYLEVPMTIKLKTNKMGDVKWYGQFGLSNGFNIKAHQRAVAVGGTVLADSENISDEIKWYRAGLILGAGGEYDLDGHTSIAVGLTFNNGFTNIATQRNRNVKNHYVGLNFAVFF